MKLLGLIIKIPILLFSKIIRLNKDSLKFLFNVALKAETADYCENQHFRYFAHIEKAINLVKKSGKEAGTIIDVGGADGTTPKMFAVSFPHSEIFIFEPLKENYRHIEALAVQYQNFKLIKKAAGNENGKTFINKASRITSSSIYELNADNNSSFFSETLQSSQKEEIDITRLDDVIPKGTNVSILKIDVQGFELEVLKGGVGTLRDVCIIVLEVNNHQGYKGSPAYFEIDEFLRNNNFELFDIFPSLHDQDRLKEWDIIYTNTKHG
jgi:FkbM family methyltransferase